MDAIVNIMPASRATLPDLPELDPAAAAALRMFAECGVPRLDELPAPLAREVYARVVDLGGKVPPVARTEDLWADGVPIRVYWPDDAGEHPVLIWLHGGGWAMGSVAVADRTARALCNGARCIVASVEYALAPERPFPAGLREALAAARSIAGSAQSLGGDPSRVAIGGDCAGGNLGAVVVNELPGSFCAQVLVYPITDLASQYPSFRLFGHSQLFTREALVRFRDRYAVGAKLTDPRLSPARSGRGTLAAAPPTLMVTGGLDPLYDDNEEYVRLLRRAGVVASHATYPGQIRGFFELSTVIPAAHDAHDRVVEFLQAVWEDNAIPQ